MRIALDCTLLSSHHTYSIALAQQLLASPAPGADWVVLQSPSTAGLVPLVDSASIVSVQPPPYPVRALWYDYKMPALLKKHCIQACVSMAGYLSLRSPLPHIMPLYDYWHPPAWNTPARPPATPARLRSMLHQATAVFTDYEASIPHKWLAASNQWHFTGPVKPIPEASDMVIPMESYTAGCQYFLCPVHGWQMEELVDLLLAFSAFKKRMRCSLKLVLAGQPAAKANWEEKYNSYRYRDDIIRLPLSQAVQHWHTWLAHAWALLLPGAAPQYRHVQAAVQAGTPVVCAPHPLHTALAGDALFTLTNDPGHNLAAYMMLLYKDERARNLSIAAQQSIQAAEQMVPAARLILNQLQLCS